MNVPPDWKVESMKSHAITLNSRFYSVFYRAFCSHSSWDLCAGLLQNKTKDIVVWHVRGNAEKYDAFFVDSMYHHLHDHNRCCMIPWHIPLLWEHGHRWLALYFDSDLNEQIESLAVVGRTFLQTYFAWAMLVAKPAISNLWLRLIHKCEPRLCTFSLEGVCPSDIGSTSAWQAGQALSMPVTQSAVTKEIVFYARTMK